MPVKNQSIVSIEKCVRHDDPDAVRAACVRLLDRIGGIESIVSPGDRVMLKPNLILDRHYTSGVTTNPHVVFAVADLCREAGAREVTVAEGSAVGADTEAVLRNLGYYEMAAAHGCRIVNFHKDTYLPVVNPMGRNIKRIRLPQSWMESDVVINLPCMKTHDALGATLGLKNMKGVIHPSDKKRFHKWGLEQCIVDLAHLTLPELTLMDGTIGLEGDGPVVGDAVGLGLLLASRDTVALDRICLDIMGFEPEEVEYVAMAARAGLGRDDRKEIVVLGEDPAAVRRPFRRMSLDHALLSELDIRVLPCDACSGCQHVIGAYLNSRQAAGTLEDLRGTTFVYGQNPHLPLGALPSGALPDGPAGRIVRFGSCTRTMSELGTYIPGCPPHPNQVDDAIAK
jgi:uncharacterized protein (DUF362 family)